MFKYECYFNINVARSNFNKDMYYVLKETFPKLNTAMIQSTYRTVKARYDAVETQLSKKPYVVWSGEYNKKGKKIYLTIDRDLEWLQKPIHFKRPQADLIKLLFLILRIPSCRPALCAALVHQTAKHLPNRKRRWA